MLERLKSPFFWLFSIVLIAFGLMYLIWGCQSDLPAWIQAAGSVLAIIASFWIAHAAQQKQQRNKQDSILAVARAAFQFVEKLHASIIEKQDTNASPIGIREFYDKSVLDGFVRALSGIPYHEVGSDTAVTALLSVQNQLVLLTNAMEKYLAGPYALEDFQKACKDYDDDPDRVKKQKELRAEWEEVLIKNVLTHIAVIEKDFQKINKARNGYGIN